MHFSEASLPLVLFSSLVLLLACPLGRGGKPLEQCGFTAIYCFGDSLFDAGNALAEFPGGPMGRFPNGVTIHEATGRFCDGYTIIDRIGFHGAEVRCDHFLSPVAALHNRLLQRELHRLRKKFPGVHIVYGDMWSATQWLFDHFWSAGIHHPSERCCGNSSIGCGFPGAPYCHNPSDYLIWDGIHSTDHAYRIMFDFLIPQLATRLRCAAGGAAAPHQWQQDLDL